jgi:transposase
MKEETLRRRFLKVVKEERAKGKRYEEIALEIGISIDTMRKFMYNSKKKVSDLTLQKIKNWMHKIKKKEVEHGEKTS